MTQKQLAKASDADLAHRLTEIAAYAHQHNGLTRKGWTEFHAIHTEQTRRAR